MKNVIQRAPRTSVMVRIEPPAVHAVFDQFIDRLAVKAAQDRHTRCECLIDHEAPGVGQGRDDADVRLPVIPWKLVVRNVAEEPDFQAPRDWQLLKLASQRSDRKSTRLNSSH